MSPRDNWRKIQLLAALERKRALRGKDAMLMALVALVALGALGWLLS